MRLFGGKVQLGNMPTTLPVRPVTSRACRAGRNAARAAAVIAVAAGLTMLPSTGTSAAPSAEKLVLVGTVTAVNEVATTPPSARNWGVTVRVERVTSGKYSQPTFTFTIHSPARAGLTVGHRYTIQASWTGEEYVVDETRPIKDQGSAP